VAGEGSFLSLLGVDLDIDIPLQRVQVDPIAIVHNHFETACKQAKEHSSKIPHGVCVSG
jgi:hypothetical protein